jgi:carboxypeptidase Taq
MMSQTLIEQVYEHARQTSLLSGTLALLEWDHHTYMPAQGGEFRSEQVTQWSGWLHQRQTDPAYGDWLRALSTPDAMDRLSAVDQANIRGLVRDYEKNVLLPESLVKATARATSRGQQIWVEARQKRDFGLFRDILEEIVKLRREEASILQKPGRTRYDSLLDQYEEGADSSHVEKVFTELRASLVPLVREALEREAKHPSHLAIAADFPIGGQRALSRWVAEKIGFDFERGRLDETEHPFCTTLGPHDHRILTRYHLDSYSSGLYGVLHEAGHGMYEQGLPVAMHGLPAGAAASLGVHESQSRLWENLVGRSRGFWTWLYPEAIRHMPGLAGVSIDQILADLRRVERSLIRIEADEATYNLHIFIRFEIEKRLIDEDLPVEELPSLWRDRYREYLDIEPSHDGEGVLQDVHWSAGLIGYFPTYALGNLYAAQLMESASRDLGDLESMFACGEFQPLLAWLRDKVHVHGRSFLPDELMRMANGVPLSAQPFLNDLTKKRARAEAG